MSVADILRVSSNVGTVQIAYQKLSGKGEAAHGEFFAPYIDRFGFTRKTGIDLPGEVKGQVPPYAKWSGTTIGNIPFGQGIASSPMQLGAFYAMLAAGGVWHQPHIVTRVNDKPVAVKADRELPKRVTKQLTKMLEDVVKPGGTGELAAIPGYRVAGKTGTTQKVDRRHLLRRAVRRVLRRLRAVARPAGDDARDRGRSGRQGVPRRRGCRTGLRRGDREGPAGAGRAPAEGSVASPA